MNGGDEQIPTIEDLMSLRDQPEEWTPFPGPSQQTIVGEISGAGDRHIIDEEPAPALPHFPNPPVDSGPSGGVDVAVDSTGDFAEGETVVNGVKRITFNSDLFKIHNNGGGEVQVTLKTTTCS